MNHCFLENIQFNTTFENTWDDFSQARKGEGNELCVFVKTPARIESNFTRKLPECK